MSATHTPLIELSDEEYRSFLAREAERAVGMSVADFIAAYGAGELDDSDPEVARIAALLALGQNGAA